MASESSAPPPPGGGGLKYGLIGLLLLGGAAGVWLFMQGGESGEPKAEAPSEPADEGPKRSTDLSQSEFVIPEEEPDAGAPEPEQEEPSRPARRRARGCDGEIDPREAMAVINRHRNQVRSCYERRLKVNNVLQGTLKIQLRIGTGGQVQSVNVGGSLRDAQVHACVRQLARSWKFPEPEGGCAVLAAPFSFTPKE